MSSTVETEKPSSLSSLKTEGRVRLLPDGLINKIAAGEVIERPASVVKELMENAIDARATRIEVEVEEGGRGLIAIRDDGEGMTRADALMALERHATSKLRSDEDLFRISSLGFRGEALPSIAEVSRFELLTGAAGEAAGTRLVLDGGVWGEVEDAGNPGGTEIRVRRLFFNTPVRLKFLKTPRTEMNHILDVVQRMALSHPQIAVKLISDGRTVLDASKGQTLVERVRQVLGKAVAGGLQPIAARLGPLKLEGLVSGVRLHRANRAGLYLFVNGRFVRDRSFVGALLSAYREVLPRGRYPVAVLFLDLPPADVDVNVHPAKVEVRFKDSSEIWRFVGGATSSLLHKMASGGGAQDELFVGGVRAGRPSAPLETSVVEKGPRSQPTPFPSQALKQAERAMDRARPVGGVAQTHQHLLDPLGIAATPLGELGAPPAAALWNARLVRRESSGSSWGQGSKPQFAHGVMQGWFGAWLLWSLGEELLLIDPRAAHRRLVFSNLRQGQIDRRLESRRLLVPELFEGREGLTDLLENLEDDLVSRGLEVSDFGGGSLALHAGPLGLEPARLRAAFASLVQRDDQAGGMKRDDLLYELDSLLSWFAGPTQASELEAALLTSLVAQLDTAAVAFACPFGFPTCARLTREDAEVWFRQGS